MGLFGVSKAGFDHNGKRKSKSEKMAGGFNSSGKAAQFIVSLLKHYLEENSYTEWDDETEEEIVVIDGDGPKIGSIRQDDRLIKFVAGNFDYTMKISRERIVKPRSSTPPPLNLKEPV